MQYMFAPHRKQLEEYQYTEVTLEEKHLLQLFVKIGWYWWQVEKES